jgi:hypothetical protein
MPLHRGKLRGSETGYLITIPPRALTRDDLMALKEPNRNPASVIAKLRESHHMVARLAALGLTNKEIAGRTGYSINRISMLRAAPAMKDLIAKYMERIDDKYDDEVEAYFSLIAKTMVQSERQISDKLDEADEKGELLPTRELLAISRDAADRLGYGKHTTQTNVNVDFAQKLEGMLLRSGRKDLTLNSPTVVSGVGQASSPRLAPPTTLRRRA